jgi:hypothetical protein
MDYKAADAVLLAYEQAVAACDEKPMLSGEREAAIKDLDNHIPKVNRILAQLTPDHRQLKTGGSLRDHKLNVRFVNNRARDLIEFSHMINLCERIEPASDLVSVPIGNRAISTVFSETPAASESA